mmetsp:Transcript_5294/g.12740  ORF Transcript_5294/g.12740 Transcript_5294/m.12740 type:complete len:399 (+) Transcript_5294:56-1252(+)
MPKTENEQAGPGEDERPSKKQATEPATAAGDGGKEKGANGSSAHRNPTVEANLKEALAGEDKSLYNYHMPAGEKGASDVTKTFNRDGVVVVPGFCSAEEVAGMKKRMQELIDAWDPSESKGSVFHTYGNKHINTNYFLDSAATTKFFLEPGAVDEKGEIRSDIPKGELINKVGHALHFLDPVFTAYAQSEKVKSLVRDLGYVDPVLPQSMYIFKQGKIGGEVTSHQDSSYLYTVPRQTCLGMWLALDDADTHNGCLWARKGSHKEPLRNIFGRLGTEEESGEMRLVNKLLDDNGDNNEESTGFKARKWCNVIPGEGPDYTPESDACLRAAGFEPLPVKAGDLVCFPGTLDHLSLTNKSPAARHTFQLHLVEGPGDGVKWADMNWMQYPAGLTFPSLKL